MDVVVILHVCVWLLLQNSVLSLDALMESESSSRLWDEQLYTRDLDIYKNKFRFVFTFH